MVQYGFVDKCYYLTVFRRTLLTDIILSLHLISRYKIPKMPGRLTIHIGLRSIAEQATTQETSNDDDDAHETKLDPSGDRSSSSHETRQTAAHPAADRLDSNQSTVGRTAANTSSDVIQVVLQKGKYNKGM